MYTFPTVCTGATPNVFIPRYITPISQTCGMSGYPGAHTTNVIHSTPRLITACKRGYYRIIKTIIEYGDDVNVQDSEGKTPLIVACENGNTEVVELLLSHGAKVNMQTNDNSTSLMFASRYMDIAMSS